MQIAPIGALEATLANLTTSISSQQQITAGSAAQPGNRMVGAKQEKHDAAKVNTPERGDVATRAGQQVSQASSGANQAMAGQSSKPERTEPIVERQLFDYLAEAEKAGGGTFTDPSALFGSAVRSLDGTMQQVQKALGQANAPVNADAAKVQDDAGKTAPSGEEGENSPAKNAEQLLERSISVMWAAANLEVVTSSVTAVTSSTSTLIKQQ
ncbi:hypothetical protein [Mesorhizobium sp.]|uniref:hypothetical protein n=1 Tax=Mesorhizobium sp. TaxID=1871066 RepID=UPI000FE5EF04|nr:hypothetical protein [Mesorhizobium sp.]RWC62429.1 MAG: hypothetical protein EOS56_07730 [Mesorhizobium sp.]RWC65737.1 MAG: hypothetical protein EOS29_07895 [Mesorhizobium sp.]